MSDPLKAFMQQNALSAPAFPPDSRYHGLEVAHVERADGESIAYVRRRFIPPPERFATLREHRVAEGDRLDNLAAQHLGDPQQYYRLCDGNGALRPDELTEDVGRRLRITLPEGVPGASDD